jgi:hypothetical protein
MGCPNLCRSIQVGGQPQLKFEINKLAIMHLGCKKNRVPLRNKCTMNKPKLMLQGREINMVDHYKYLSIIIDDKLSWRKHKERVIDNTTKFVMQCCCLAKTDSGLSHRLMDQLHLSVAIPEMTYVAKIWYNPP